MSYEQTTNTSDRSTQVEEIITELANCRGVPPSLFRRIVCLADMALKYEAMLASKRKYWHTRSSLEPARSSDQTRSSLEPARTSPIEEKKDKKVSKNISIPDDFSPDQGWAMKKMGWDQAKAEWEAERFRNHYLASGAKWKDWHRVWCKWVTSPYQQKGNGNGTSAYTRQPTKKERLGDLMQTLGSGKFWEDFTRNVPQRDDTGREAIRGVDDWNIHYLPVRSSEGGSESNGNSDEPSDFFAVDRPNKRVAEE